MERELVPYDCAFSKYTWGMQAPPTLHNEQHAGQNMGGLEETILDDRCTFSTSDCVLKGHM